MKRIWVWFWSILAVLALIGLFWLNWKTGQTTRTGYLFDMPTSNAEAAYCIAVAERVREITHGMGDAKLESYIDELMAFYRKRATGAMTLARAALSRDSSAQGVNEGAHLHLAIQDCGTRAVRFYGVTFRSMQ